LALTYQYSRIASPCQDLGLPFELHSISELADQFREFAILNHAPQHAFKYLSQQTAGHCCCLCPSSSTCALPDDIDLGVLGAPCTPFSMQRTKRTHENSVESHTSYDVLMVDGVSFIIEGNGKTYVVEQVKGFTEAMSSTDETTPLSRRISAYPTLPYGPMP
jgi:site-specific DNA-cytosine methylase